MICLISALLLLRSADALEVPVEVVSPAISIGRLCAELQERTHVGLAASHELRDEIVVVRARNTTLAQVTENLAETMDAEWVKGEGTLVLTRPAATKIENLRRDELLHSRGFEKLLSQVRTDVQRVESTSSRARAAYDAFLRVARDHAVADHNSPFDPNSRMPVDWLLSELLIRMGGERLAALPCGPPVVFSDLPTPSQRRFPERSSDLLAQFVETEHLAIRLFEGLDPKLAGDLSLQIFLQGMRLSGGVGKFNLLIHRLSTDQVWCLLAVYDPNGTRKGTSVRILNAERSKGDLDLGDPPPDGTFALPTVSAEYLGQLRDVKLLRPTVQATPALRQVIETPTQFDPLGTVVGPTLIAIAEVKGCNLLAHVGDDALDAVDATEPEKGVSMGLALSRFESLGYRSKLSGTWLRITPDSIERTIRERTPRPALQRFVRAVVANGKVGLRDYAKLFAEVEYAPLDLAMRTVALTPCLGVRKPRQRSLSFPRALLRLLGSIEDTAWSELMAGRSIDISRAPEHVRSALLDWCGQSLTVGERESGANPSPADLRLTGTEAMPRGIAPGTLFSATQKAETVVTIPGYLQDSSQSLPLLDAAEIGNWTSGIVRAGWADGLEDALDGILQVGEVDKWTFSVRPGGGVVFQNHFLVEDRFSLAKPYVSGELPAEFRQAVQKAYDGRMKAHGGAGFLLHRSPYRVFPSPSMPARQCLGLFPTLERRRDAGRFSIGDVLFLDGKVAGLSYAEWL